jgi:putative redox protein
MISTKIQLRDVNKMAFDADLNGHNIKIDSVKKVGGEDYGVQPKPLLLVALGGCTAMDVISILRKMRVELEDFSVDVSGESSEGHPVYYKKLHIEYHFKGKDLPMEKLEKAVSLSQERYCGVSYMLGKAAEITHEIILD